jgi:protein gp37
MIFVNSMSDLFHEQIPIEFICQVFDTMAAAPWHTFQVLTKRVDRLAAIADRLNWSPNIWIGATVENQECVSRADNLRKIPAKIRFLSCEPLLEPVELNLKRNTLGHSGRGKRTQCKTNVRIMGFIDKRPMPYFWNTILL